MLGATQVDGGGRSERVGTSLPSGEPGGCVGTFHVAASPGSLLEMSQPDLQTRTALWTSELLSVDEFVCQMSPHRHGVEEVSGAHSVVFVRSGAFFRTIEGESVLADPAHVLFFSRGQSYRVTHPIAGGDRCTIVTAPAPTLLEIGRQHDPGWPEDPDAPFAIRQGLATARAALLHQALLRNLRSGALDALGIHELILELLDEVIRRTASTAGRDHGVPAVTVRARELAEAARIALTERYATPPSLEGLAQTLGCSPFHLCRTFRRVAGLPLRRYLDRLRLRLALDRLGGGAPCLTALALDLGYADHSHFTNAFRREFGRPPSELRSSTSRKGSGRSA
jgi:AraC family transcriptional regulator